MSMKGSEILAEALKSRQVVPDRPEELSQLEGLAARREGR